MSPSSSAAHPPAPSAVNRKKQKRRDKEAAKKAVHEPEPEPSPLPSNGVSSAAHARRPVPQYADDDLDEGAYDDEVDYYSDEDADHYEHAYGTNGHYQHQHQQGYAHVPIPPPTGKKPRRKKKGAVSSAPPPLAYTQHVAPRHSPAPAHTSNRSGKKDRIWNTSTVEERERIREFWLSLGEDDRKSLVKIEKEAVLRKMKEQQKHSCSCSVCGRKRTAIEEELEVLYDAYYEELEQYALHQPDVSRFLPDANFGHASSAPHPRPLMNTHPPPDPYDEEDDEEYSDEEDEEEFSGSEISSDREYESDPSMPHHREAVDFLRFGSSLQVKGTPMVLCL